MHFAFLAILVDLKSIAALAAVVGMCVRRYRAIRSNTMRLQLSDWDVAQLRSAHRTELDVGLGARYVRHDGVLDARLVNRVLFSHSFLSILELAP